ncbi:MAG TPA: YggT family protein [Gammaproteobacteria bacterium]|nr:YggT family protein [Gammaproteobacteria bacterium]
MENVFLFLFRTFVDFITIVLILRLIASRWISANNPIHQSIVLITSPIIRPFTSRFSKRSSLAIILVSLCLLIELFALWFMTTINCLNGPNFLQLIGLGTMKLMILFLRIFFISILAHVILTWLSPNSFTPATRFIGELVAPVLRPIKARLPYLAGLDFSPLIAVVIIQSIIMIIPINTVFSGILCSNFRQIL